MVIWVTEIQGDEFQQSFRKYEGLDSSLNSVPTMNVQLWMTYEWMTIPVICGYWTFFYFFNHFIEIALKEATQTYFIEQKPTWKIKTIFKLPGIFSWPRNLNKWTIRTYFYAREWLVACLKITHFPAGTIFRPKYISLCLFPTIHTDVRSGSLYYNHFAFVAWRLLYGLRLPVTQFNLKHCCHVNLMSRVTIFKPFKP